MRNILYIVPSDYESLYKKGVTDMILQRDEGGFFDKVFTLHPFTKNNKVIKLKESNIIFEYGWKSRFDFLNRFKITKIFGTLKILFKLAFIFPFQIKKEKISIIRATDPYYMGLIAFYYSRLLKIPFVVSVHSDYDKGAELGGQTFRVFGSRNMAKKIEKFVYRKADKVLPIREYLKKKIISEYGISGNKIDIFPHGISFKEFNNTRAIDIYENFQISNNKKIISFVGRMSNENYVYDILEIAKKLSEYRNDFIILIIGAGNEYENIARTVKNERLSEIIKLTGFQPKEIVVNVRRQSYLSLCLMAGFSLIEACAAAKPVVSYDIEWHSELVKDDRTGYLARENDIKSVVEKINYLLDNEEISKNIGKNARELAVKNHDIINTTKIKQKIYKEVLND